MGSMPMMSFANVDLPPPFGPVITVKLSLGIVSESPSMMRRVSVALSFTGTSNTMFFSSSIAFLAVSLVWPPHVRCATRPSALIPKDTYRDVGNGCYCSVKYPEQ